MEHVAAQNCICQSCRKIFPANKTMLCVINIDENDDLVTQFNAFEINSVTCPKCHNSFTFEIPTLVYSKSLGFAVYTASSSNPEKGYSAKSIPTWLIYEYKTFRKCMYLAEAVEKFRIFRDGLNDKHVEYLKLCLFSEHDTLPFDEINMIYSHMDESVLYFNKIDFNNNIISTYNVSKVDMINLIQDVDFCDESNNWSTINRLTIRNYIK